MSAADPYSAQLDELAQVAFRLGKLFGREAETAKDAARQIEFVRLFDRCFFAFRVSIALQLRLRQEARRKPAGGREAERAEAPEAALEREPAERDDSVERPERYGERDRDREPASLPILLNTLQGVADAAEALPGPRPAELPTLRELLARVQAQPSARPAAPKAPSKPEPQPRPATAPAGALAVLARPPPAQPSARTRLLLAAAPLPGARHRATGPP